MQRNWIFIFLSATKNKLFSSNPSSSHWNDWKLTWYFSWWHTFGLYNNTKIIISFHHLLLSILFQVNILLCCCFMTCTTDFFYSSKSVNASVFLICVAIHLEPRHTTTGHIVPSNVHHLAFNENEFIQDYAACSPKSFKVLHSPSKSSINPNMLGCCWY